MSQPGDPPQIASPAARAHAQRITRRAWALIVRPRAELQIIAAEETTLQALFLDYLAPLAAIPALAVFLRKLASGLFDPFAALAVAVVTYGASVLGVYLIGEIAYRLAAQFGARGDKLAAMKSVVYGSTPLWLAGIVFLLPSSFDFFFVFSLYSLYVLDRALPILMKAPPKKLRGFEATIVGAAIVVFILLATFSAMIAHPRVM
jgi:Yip1 domain